MKKQIISEDYNTIKNLSIYEYHYLLVSDTISVFLHV